MRYVVVENNVVRKTLDIPEGLEPSDVGGEAKWLPSPSDVQLGWVVSGGEFEPPEDQPESLETIKQGLKMMIDASAEAERLKYITPGAGQAMTYQEKISELARYDTDTNPVKDNYPMLSSEIGITATSLAGVADAVRSAYGAWREVGRNIEVARLRAKMLVESASSENEARSAADVDWPSPFGL